MAKLNFFLHTNVFFCTFRKNFNGYELFQRKKEKVLVQGFTI